MRRTPNLQLPDRELVCSSVGDVCALRLAIRLGAMDRVELYRSAISESSIGQFFARLSAAARSSMEVDEIKHRLAEKLN